MPFGLVEVRVSQEVHNFIRVRILGICRIRMFHISIEIICRGDQQLRILMKVNVFISLVSSQGEFFISITKES